MTEKTLDPATFDRTDLTIRHEGPLVLPHDIIFHRLHFLALNSNTSAVKDAARNLDASYQQLLTDVVATRNRIRATIKEKTLRSIYDEREVSFVVTAHGYEFVVIFLAVLALGGIVVPTSRINLGDFTAYGWLITIQVSISPKKNSTMFCVFRKRRQQFVQPSI